MKRAALEQAAEHDRLTKLKEEVEVAQTAFAGAKEAAAMERSTLASLEACFHKA